MFLSKYRLLLPEISLFLYKFKSYDRHSGTACQYIRLSLYKVMEQNDTSRVKVVQWVSGTAYCIIRLVVYKLYGCFVSSRVKLGKTLNTTLIVYITSQNDRK